MATGASQVVAVSNSQQDFLANMKPLNTTIEMNIFIPKDPYMLTPEFRLLDMIDDHIENFERMKYHVSFIITKFLSRFLKF